MYSEEDLNKGILGYVVGVSSKLGHNLLERDVLVRKSSYCRVPDLRYELVTASGAWEGRRQIPAGEGFEMMFRCLP
jgi:hypothetical protein